MRQTDRAPRRPPRRRAARRTDRHMSGALAIRARNAPLGELVSDALANLYALRQRSSLALLGIVIGTASVVAMLTIGHMAEREALSLFSAMGVDMLQIRAQVTGSRSRGL